MNKLLLLALLGFALVAISGAEEEKAQNIKEIEELENRENREAGRKEKETKRKRKSGKKTGKKVRRKSRKKSGQKSVRKSGKKAGRKSGKKAGGKSRKSGKNSGRKSRKMSGRKTGRKSGKKSGQNSRKKSGKKGQRKSKNKSGKKTGRKQAPNIRASTCLNISCIDLATGYLKMLKGKIANFDKQNTRIARQNKTGSNKSGKKGIFGPVIRRITENGGGNSTNLTCNGQSNSGAKQLTNLTTTLLNCEGEIKKACDPSSLPHPNITEVTKCDAAMTIFKNISGTCLKKNGSEACTCWGNSALVTSSKTITACDLSSGSKLFAKALKNCTNAFSKCRKYEDDVGTAIHACTLKDSVLKRKLKNLKQNSAALSALKTQIDSAATRRSARDASTRALSCTALTTTSTTIIFMVSQNPVSYSIFTLIQSVVTVTVTCTDTEKIALKAVSNSIAIAITVIAAEVTHIQETLVLLTGSSLSDSEIDSQQVCTSDDDCDSLVEFTEETSSSSTSAPSPAAPSPAAPSPAAPSPAAQSPAAPSPPAPSPAVSSTPAPSPSDPSTAAPSPAAPSPPASSTAAPSPPAPSTAAPSTADPTAAAPSTAAPSMGAASTAAPSTAAPSTTAPTAAAPSTAAPSIGAASTAAPSIAAPATAAPSTAAQFTSTTPYSIPETTKLMTTGASTKRSRRYVEHLMRKRMVQTLI